MVKEKNCVAYKELYLITDDSLVQFLKEKRSFHLEKTNGKI